MIEWVTITEEDVERAFWALMEHRLDRLYYHGINYPKIDPIEAMIEYDILRHELFRGDVNASIRRKD